MKTRLKCQGTHVHCMRMMCLWEGTIEVDDFEGDWEFVCPRCNLVLTKENVSYGED